jgi:alkylation response protein AidB-like acyl-CoA dehydrogenase
MSPATTLDNVRALAPAIRRRSDEIEDRRRLPLDLVADLKTAGCFRMLVPRHYDGDELPLGQAFEVLEELACADGAAGWTTMIGSSSPVLFGRLPKPTLDEIYAQGPDVIGAGALAPKGRALAVEGGYCLSGQWPFASGCQHADWLLAQAMVMASPEQPKLRDTGTPVMRVAVFPAAAAELVDTWHTAGLRGTGSHDFRLEGLFCPEARTFGFQEATPALPSPVLRIPVLALLPLLLASVAVGIGRGALDDIADLAAAGKRRVYAAQRMAASPVFQDRFGEADAIWRAARALLHTEADQAWAKATRDDDVESFSLLERARLRATGSQVVALVTQVVDAAYAAGGGSAVYEASPLQRRLRDIHTLTQHIGISRDAFGQVGALLAGEEVDPLRPL